MFKLGSENSPLRAGGAALSEPDTQLIRGHAAASDISASLAPRLQALIHQRGWLRMLAPASTGGAELALPDAVRLEESLAAADGSVGWVVTLCAGASWFAGFLPPAFAGAIVDTTNLCIGGSGAPSGFADADGEGYRLSGHWQFATGAPIATHFTLNAVLREGGQPLQDGTGAPRVRAFIVPTEHVRVHDSWRSIGLRATASNSFSIDNAWVSGEHAFEINAASATAPGPLYRFPFLSLAYVTIAANISGMAGHFLELASASIARRRHPTTGQTLAEIPEIRKTMLQAQGDLVAAREHFYRLLDRMWEMVCRDAIIAGSDTHALHAASLGMVRAARSAVDEVYPYCGLHAAHEASDIGRIWRDLHTATQHAMLLPPSW